MILDHIAVNFRFLIPFEAPIFWNTGMLFQESTFNILGQDDSW